MIHKIHIKNFQSHKDTQLEFHPGVNIIVGGSDSGKTAVIRALRWLAWNRPAGEAFRSDWGGDTEATITVDDRKITRRKTDKTNEYTLDDVRFTAFGTEVPEDIQKLLQLDNVNLQSQLDSPFLLSKSAGEVAAHFNKVAHLEKIDISIQNISSWLRKLERDVDMKEATLVDQQEKLQEYENLDRIEVHVEILEQDQTELQNQFSAILKLRKLKDDIIYYSEQITALAPLISAEKGINELLGYQEKIKVQKNQEKSLVNAIKQLTELEQEIKQQSDVLQAEKQVSDLLESWHAFKTARKSKEALKNLVMNINNIGKREEEKIGVLKGLQLKFEENFPNTCPLCGKPK